MIGTRIGICTFPPSGDGDDRLGTRSERGRAYGRAGRRLLPPQRWGQGITSGRHGSGSDAPGRRGSRARATRRHQAPTAAAAVCKGRAGRGRAGPSPGSSSLAGGGVAARSSASGGAGCGSAMGKKHKKHKAEKAEWRSTSATAYSGKGQGGLFVPGTRPSLPQARLTAGPGVPARALGAWAETSLRVPELPAAGAARGTRGGRCSVSRSVSVLPTVTPERIRSLRCLSDA